MIEMTRYSMIICFGIWILLDISQMTELNPTVAYRRTRGDMIEIYKLLHEKYDSKRQT